MNDYYAFRARPSRDCTEIRHASSQALGAGEAAAQRDAWTSRPGAFATSARSSSFESRATWLMLWPAWVTFLNKPRRSMSLCDYGRWLLGVRVGSTVW
jgi:hypothetical protein